jgi:hypothetical protein
MMIQIMLHKIKSNFWWIEAEARVNPKARAGAKQKHIEIKYHYFRDEIEKSKLKVCKISTLIIHLICWQSQLLLLSSRFAQA